MRTLLIDTEYEIEGCTLTTFEANLSCFDYDLVIWDPAGSYNRLRAETYEIFQNCPALSLDDSVQWRNAIARRKAEFSDLLKLGRTVVVVLSGHLYISLDTGNRETSGTGRNAVSTLLHEQVDILDASPVPLKVVTADGDRIEVVDTRIQNLWQTTLNAWSYCAYFVEPVGVPLLKIVGTDKVVGSLVQEPDEGMAIFLPDLWFADGAAENPDDLTSASFEESRSSGSDLSGPQALIDWVYSLQTPSEVERPSWFDEYQFETEIARIGKQADIETEIAVLESQLNLLKSEHVEDERWKWLISASGTALENQVQRAFELLGFEILPAVQGRADIRLRLEGRLYVVEVKGVSKSGAERNAAQLEKWVAIELENEEEAKGILVVNSWRMESPADRTKETFPDQMISYSTKREHCLVSGLQLLVMSRLALDDASRAVEFRKTLVETVGRVSMFDDYTQVLTRTVNGPSDGTV